MISHNPDINCTNARLYYYDFVHKETRIGIPQGALNHIRQCRDCRTEVDRLKDLLVQADEKLESEQSRKDSAISTLLKLHFEYIGEPITCDTVKPFLGSLADPALQIRIPTPITTHIDKCPSCRDDLLTLLDLHLPHKYLCRLGQLLADKPVEDNISCSQARAAIPAVVSMAFHETNAEILKHLCTCPYCRKELYIHRETVRKELLHNWTHQNGFPCESVTATDIYDYCMPYGIDPADDQYFEFRESLTSHLRTCPKCLAKIQQLHRVISNIAERAESEVITIYNIGESAKTKASCESEPYAGFQSGSEIAGTEDNLHIEQPKTVNLTAQLKQKASALNMKPLLKAGLVAAVIVIGLALLLNAPTAKAVTIEQICRAFENAKNVYIATFTDKMELKQERWVSRSLNIYLSKTEKESVLLDLANKVRKIKDSNTGSVENLSLPTETIVQIKNMMTGFLGLVPSTEVSAIPDDSEWNRVTSNELIADSNTAIYELTSIKITAAENKVFEKWRYFVDPKTYLPSKIQSYTKKAVDSKYTLQSTIEFEYLSDSEMEDIVKKASF